MKAFQSVRAEMRENAISITHPYAGAARKPMHREPEEPHDEEDDEGIEPWMEIAFENLTHASETGAPFALVPCTMNGDPAVIIALARPEGPRRMHVMPLFVACQPWMKFSGPAQGGDEDEGGGADGTRSGDSPEPR